MDKNADKTDRKKKFLQICIDEVFPYLKGHEVLRKKLYSSFLIKKVLRNVCLCVFLVCAFVFLFYFTNVLAFMFFMVVFMITVKNKGKLFLKEEKFGSELKHFFLENVMKAFGDLYWNKNARIFAERELQESGLFANCDVQYCDSFIGKYKNAAFKVCEVKMSGFKGAVIEIQRNKTLKTQTIVSTIGDLTERTGLKVGILISGLFLALYLFIFSGYFLSQIDFIRAIPQMYSSVKSLEDFIGITIVVFVGGGIMLACIIFVVLLPICIHVYMIRQSCKALNGKEKIILEDVKFEKKYQVYSDNQLEARYVVTPAFMEKFLNLRTSFGAKKAKCSFYGDKIMFAISTKKDLFEIGTLNKSLLDSKTFKVLFEEINAIYDIIDHFDLID